MDEGKVKARQSKIDHWPTPIKVIELCSFLKLAYLKIAMLLINLLKK